MSSIGSRSVTILASIEKVTFRRICRSLSFIPTIFLLLSRTCYNYWEEQCAYRALDNALVLFGKDQEALPCTKRDYTGTQSIQVLDDSIINHGSKTNFVVVYGFDKPETTKIIEQYYVMAELDLFGLIGGTLGMFVEFSIYGSISFILDLIAWLLLRTLVKGKWRLFIDCIFNLTPLKIFGPSKMTNLDTFLSYSLH